MCSHAETYTKCQIPFCYTGRRVCACVDLITCVAVRYLILRTGCEKHGRKNPLPYSFSKRSPVSGLRQIRKQGKGRSSKRKENRRLSFLFALRRGRGESPRSAERNSSLDFKRKTSRPLGANTLTQFECPAQPVQRKEPPRQDEHACGSSRTPVSRCREKGCRPLGANRLCGSCTPLSRCRIEKKPIFNRKNLRKPARTDCLSRLYLL